MVPPGNKKTERTPFSGIRSANNALYEPWIMLALSPSPGYLASV